MINCKMTPELKNETILIFSINKWKNWRQPNNLSMILSKNNRVIFIEYFPRSDNGFSNRKGKLSKYFGIEQYNINENILVISPPRFLPMSIPFLSNYFKDEIAYLSIRLSRWLHALVIKRYLSKNGISPTVIFCCDPLDFFLLKRINANKICYLVYDEVSYFMSNRWIQNIFEKIEEKNINKANYVFTSSRSQYLKRKDKHPRVYFIPNAVDFDLFNKELDFQKEPPDDIKNIQGTIIGFHGIIDHRFDFKLLEKIAVEKKEYSIVLIGPCRKYVNHDLQKVVALKNVFYLGNKNIEDVPRYVKKFDIGLIPYVINEMTNTMFPLKLYEYLAMGKPVVSTDLFEIKEFNRLVRIGKTTQELIFLIAEEIEYNNPRKIKYRVETARNNSWENRINKMAGIINAE